MKRSALSIGLPFALLACDQTAAPSATQSRVQAVLQTAETANGTSGGQAPHEADKAAGAALPTKSRAAFCSEASAPGKPFTPKLPPRRVAAPGEPALPELAFATQHWTWVNFWAAWCAPCKQELPLLLKWQLALNRELDFAFVSLDDDARQLDQFLASQPAAGLKSSYWLPDGPIRQAWLQGLELTSEPELPMQLLIDPSGKIRCRIQGAIDAGDQTALEKVIRGQN